jgi:hypothetical protein
LHELLERVHVKDDVMNDSVDTSLCRYAVIIVQSEPDREQVVIAYTDQETLRGLFAAPGIVAPLHSSPADALKNIDRYVATAPSLKRLRTAKLGANMTYLTLLRRLAGGFGFLGPSKVMRNLVHSGLAAAVVFLYSKNVLSSTVRSFISF